MKKKSYAAVLARAAGLAGVLWLLAGCNIEPAITLIRLTPEEDSVAKGGTLNFMLEVAGEGDVELDVLGSIVESGHSSGTYVEEGMLKVATDEQLEALTVRVTSTWDTSKYDEARITVK